MRSAYVVLSVAFALAMSGITSSARAGLEGRLEFAMHKDQAIAIGEIVTLGMRNVYVSGAIADGDTERFQEFVRSHNLQAATVVFNSPGGSLIEGVKLGRAIRELQFYTAVGAITDRGGRSAAICASACAYAYAGGISRFLDDSSGRLGIHQFRSSTGPGVSESNAQIVSGILVAYLREMGVDPEAFAVAAVTDPDGVTWLTPKEAEALGFANNGVEPPTAEIKMAQMRPYLRLNQNKAAVTIRVLFLCNDRRLYMQAGIVTDPEQSEDIAAPDWQKRSYVELDGHEELVVDGPGGAKARDSTTWLQRALSNPTAAHLLKTNQLGVWIDGFGAVRAGGTIDLAKVRPAIASYFSQCAG